MVNSKAPACASIRARACVCACATQIQRMYSSRGVVPHGVLPLLRLFLPLCFTQTSFCCCRCSQVLADTFQSESFKQPHLDTQLTHSIDFFIHHIFFSLLCTVCFLKVRGAAGRPLSEILRGAPRSGVARLKIQLHG